MNSKEICSDSTYFSNNFEKTYNLWSLEEAGQDKRTTSAAFFASGMGILTWVHTISVLLRLVQDAAQISTMMLSKEGQSRADAQASDDTTVLGSDGLVILISLLV